MLAKKGLMTAPAAVAQYVEDVFSTYLYTGNGSTQTITNNIDLSGEGGLVWIKQRTDAAHALYDTVRGVRKAISSNFTLAESTASSGNELTAFNSNGFSLGTDSNYNVNSSSTNYASWTFRKAEKFFDVVKYTGNATAGRTISHNLGSTPGCIFVKRLGSAENWAVWHRGLSAGYWMQLNTTGGQTNAASADIFGNGTTYVDPTSTVFTVGSENRVNDTGSDYIAYLFAHDAGGFGEAGDQSVIKCSSFTCDGSGNATIDLGWEPQFVILKRKDTTENWEVYDNMRGLTVSSGERLRPSATDAEVNSGETQITNTGFKRVAVAANSTYIYIAIRRGPMKTPEAGTEVFSVNFGSDTTTYTTNFPLDMAWENQTTGNSANTIVGARLLGQNSVSTASTAAETTIWIPSTFWRSNSTYRFNANGNDCATYAFKRAPGFFDVVCYTGTGSSTTVSHNLGVAPELMIVKQRDGANQWPVWSNLLTTNTIMYLDATNAQGDTTVAKNTFGNGTNIVAPTSSVFTVGTDSQSNGSGSKYVAYLFSSVTGVSKVGSYTGNGSSVTVTTGFQPRFILVKRTDSTGNWIVSDSARGLIAGNDPYLLLNSTAAEDTDEDWVDISSTGFTVNQVTASNANVNTGTYIYLAIA